MKTSKLPIFIVLPLLAIIALVSSGCITKLDSSVAPGVELSELKVIFVKKLAADERGIEKLIAQELNRMGYQAVYGSDLPANRNFDAIIEYQDKWTWDLTMYMIELRVQILDPINSYTMASGESYRTSIVRKTPSEMVKEVLTEIFK